MSGISVFSNVGFAIHVVAASSYTSWELNRGPVTTVELLIRKNYGALDQQCRNCWSNLGCQSLIDAKIPAANVAMRQRSQLANSRGGLFQRFLEVPLNQKFDWWGAIGMRGGPAFKYVDIAIRGYLSKVIVGAAISQAQFEKRPWEFFYVVDRGIQTKALGL
jgi:hypothetical protein